MVNNETWRHDRDHIRMLQNAHADHIEAMYRENLSIPGNPKKIDIRTFGDTRTFFSSGEWLQNRAIFTGNETAEEFDEVLSYFVEKEADCFIEINPSNFYPTDPNSRHPEVITPLLNRGCTIEEFRTVWVCSNPLDVEAQISALNCRRVDPEQYAKIAPVIHGDSPTEVKSPAERDPGFLYYIGYHDDRPVAYTRLYFNGESGYLQEAFTQPDFRRRGYHTQMIRRRTRDAFGMGASLVLTVTDFNNQSSFNLQRNGFQLAYNYLLLLRKPIPI